MAANGIKHFVYIDEILDKYKYLNIVKNHLKESTIKLGLLENFYFHQDNDP